MDYNIYIHTVGDGNGTSSKTTPFQLKDSENSNAFEAAKETMGFVQNPDSAISKVMNTGTGILSKAFPVIGITIFAIGAVTKITDTVLTTIMTLQSIEGGESRNLIKYNNFKQTMKNIFHPFALAQEEIKYNIEVNKQNAINEQKMITFGQTVLNNPNGRYL